MRWGKALTFLLLALCLLAFPVAAGGVSVPAGEVPAPLQSVPLQSVPLQALPLQSVPIQSVPVPAVDLPNVDVHVQTPLGQLHVGTSPASPPAPPAQHPSAAVRVAQAVPTPSLVGLAATLAFGLVESARIALGKPLTLVGRVAWRALRRAGLGLAWAAAPMFSRIETDAVLANPVRARIHDIVTQGTGLCTADVQRRADVAWGTTVHHLRRLERHGLLVSTRAGGQHLYFAAAVGGDRADVGALGHATALRIASLVDTRPGIDQKGVCDVLALRNPAASKHLGRFERLGLVRRERIGKSCQYHPTQRLSRALAWVNAPAAAA